MPPAVPFLRFCFCVIWLGVLASIFLSHSEGSVLSDRKPHVSTCSLGWFVHYFHFSFLILQGLFLSTATTTHLYSLAPSFLWMSKSRVWWVPLRLSLSGDRPYYHDDFIVIELETQYFLRFTKVVSGRACVWVQSSRPSILSSLSMRYDGKLCCGFWGNFSSMTK